MGPSFTGPIHEIDADISKCRLRLSSLPRHHHLFPIYACFLAERLFQRLALLNQRDDIDKAIRYFTDALLSPTLSWLAHGPLIIEVLFLLAYSLCWRSEASKEPEDVISALKYLRFLRDSEDTPFAVQHQQVTAYLVEALSVQMKLKARDVVQILEEMTALTQELLTSDPSSDATTRASACFARAVSHIMLELSPDLLNEIIECLRLARMHNPELREVSHSLAKGLYARYHYTLGDELDEAVSILDEMIASSSPGDEFLPECQRLVAHIAMLPSTIPEHSEEAIYRARTFLSSSSVYHPLYPTWSHALEDAAKSRVQSFGPIVGLEASSSRYPAPANIAQTRKTCPLYDLLDGIRNYSITDIEGAIELGRSLSSDPSDLESSFHFGEILFEAFERTKNINYLNESIHTSRQLLARRLPKFLRVGPISRLLVSLATRSNISPGHSTQDSQEMVGLFPQFLSDGSQMLGLPHRFDLACSWALYARASQHPSTSTAYETALLLMQDVAPFSPSYSYNMPLSSHVLSFTRCR